MGTFQTALVVGTIFMLLGIIVLVTEDTKKIESIGIIVLGTVLFLLGFIPLVWIPCVK